jgi:hypothetical protein
LQIAADGLDRRGTALGIVVGALTIGSAFPHLLRGRARRALAWANVGAVAAGSRRRMRGVVDGRGRPYVSATARSIRAPS